MKIPSYLHHRSDDDRAMTSMIDVVFLLLIFFVCASVGQIRESLLATELPPGTLESNEVVEQQQPLGRVWLTLERRGGVTIAEVNSREYDDLAALEATLRGLAELAPEIPVILDIGPDVPLGDLIRVYDTCRAARFQSIHFAADTAAARKRGT